MRAPCIYTGTEDYLQPVSATLWVTAPMQDESTTLDSFGSYMLFTILASLIAWPGAIELGLRDLFLLFPLPGPSEKRSGPRLIQHMQFKLFTFISSNPIAAQEFCTIQWFWCGTLVLHCC